MKLILTSLTLAALLLATQSSAQDASALASQIAKTLGYPAIKLFTSDESALYAEKTGGEALAVYKITSTDETFAPLALAIGKQGTLLKPELEADCQANIKDGSATVKRFEIKGGVHGFAGLGMAGPGGSEERILATWPERGVDLQIKITIPRNGMKFDESTKAYYQLMMNGGSQLANKLMACMEILIHHVERADIRSDNKTRNPEPSSTSSTATQIPYQHPHRLPETTPTPTSTAPSNNLTSTKPWSMILVIIVAALGLMLLVLRRRS